MILLAQQDIFEQIVASIEFLHEVYRITLDYSAVFIYSGHALVQSSQFSNTPDVVSRVTIYSFMMMPVLLHQQQPFSLSVDNMSDNRLAQTIS